MNNSEAPFEDETLSRPSIEYLKETLPKRKRVSKELRRRGTLMAYKRALAKFGSDGCTVSSRTMRCTSAVFSPAAARFSNCAATS